MEQKSKLIAGHLTEICPFSDYFFGANFRKLPGSKHSFLKIQFGSSSNNTMAEEMDFKNEYQVLGPTFISVLDAK